MTGAARKETAAIILAGGRGSRMKSDTPKQYLMLAGRPLLYYSLKAFDDSGTDELILVTGAGEEEYCRHEIVEAYGIRKPVRITAGGRERYHSVYSGLKKAEGAEYVLIHDGARPFLTPLMIDEMIRQTREYGACVMGMPVKDTIKIVGKDHIVLETPDRSSVWQVQTPQAFRYSLIREAYDRLFEQENISVTDDAMVLESMGNHPIHMVFGSYGNLKITTPEDLLIAEGMWKIQSGNEQRKK